MPNRPIAAVWRERIRQLAEQNPGFSGRKIAAQLEEEAKAMKPKRTDSPAERTVLRIMAEHRDASPEERRQYGLVCWPESFGTPDLPWEAAPAVFEAMREMKEGHRPTVRVAKWVWRLALAAPHLEIGSRLMWAGYLAVAEGRSNPRDAEGIYRPLEQRLCYRNEPQAPVRFTARTEDMAELGFMVTEEEGGKA